MSIGYFLPVRAGSQRVKDKNTRPFAGIDGGLLELKLRQVLKSSKIGQIVLSTNDISALEIANRMIDANEKVLIDHRPEHLCLDSTPLTALINYVPTLFSTEHILWGHTTTPFTDHRVYDTAIEQYFEALINGYDSLVAVTTLQNFLISPLNGKLVNAPSYGEQWPRTQDLPLLYEVSHSVFLASKSVYIEQNNRIGRKPFFFVQDKISAFDIDWEDDFIIAEAIYKTYEQKSNR